MNSRTVKHKRQRSRPKQSRPKRSRPKQSTHKRERHQYAGTPPKSFFNASFASPMKKSRSTSKKKTHTKRSSRLHRWAQEKKERDEDANAYEAETHRIRSQNANQARSMGPHGFGLLKHMSQNTKPRIGIVRDDKTGLAKFKRDERTGNLMWYALDDVYYEHPVAPPTKM
jgi:hypothetical protein